MKVCCRGCPVFPLKFRGIITLRTGWVPIDVFLLLALFSLAEGRCQQQWSQMPLKKCTKICGWVDCLPACKNTSLSFLYFVVLLLYINFYSWLYIHDSEILPRRLHSFKSDTCQTFCSVNWRLFVECVYRAWGLCGGRVSRPLHNLKTDPVLYPCGHTADNSAGFV